RLFDRHRRDLADVRAADLYLPGFAPQAQARAIRAHRIAAIPAEEDPHVHFVLFAFQMLEEATHTPEFAITVDDVILLLAGKVLPRYVLRNACGAGVAAHLRRQRPIFWLGPGLDHPFGEGEGLVRDHQVQIEIDGVAEALTAWTRAKWIVEREQPWFRFFVTKVAHLALETLRETQSLRSFTLRRSGLEQHFAGLAVALFDRIHDARPRLRGNRDTIDQHQYRFGKIELEQGLGGRKLDHSPVLVEPVVASLAQLKQTLFQPGIVRWLRRLFLCDAAALRFFCLDRFGRRLNRKECLHARSFSEREKPLRHFIHRVLLHFLPAVQAVGAPHPGI